MPSGSSWWALYSPFIGNLFIRFVDSGAIFNAWENGRHTENDIYDAGEKRHLRWDWSTKIRSELKPTWHGIARENLHVCGINNLKIVLARGRETKSDAIQFNYWRSKSVQLLVFTRFNTNLCEKVIEIKSITEFSKKTYTFFASFRVWKNRKEMNRNFSQ